MGVDIGGTRVRAGVVTAGGHLLARAETRLPTDGEPAALRAIVAELATDVLARSGARPCAAGVALPGVWHPATTIMERAVNLPQLEGTNLGALFAEALGRAVRLEADANAAIWGQYQALAPRPDRLLYLSIGTGIGGGVILDGQIVRHTRGGAGHFGFLIVDTSAGAPGGRNDVPGCLSALASGPALHLAATGRADPAAIGEEPLPDHVLQTAAGALAIGVFNLVHIYACRLALLGGGVVDNHPRLVDEVRRAFARHASKLLPDGFEIRRAPLTTHEAGVIGAALLALAEAQSPAVR